MKCHIYTRCGVLVKNTKLHVQDEHKDEGTLSRRSVRACYKQVHPGTSKVVVQEGLSGLMEAKLLKSG